MSHNDKYDEEFRRRIRNLKRERITLQIDEIHYTHDVISSRFRTENRHDKNSAPEGPLLEETFQDLAANPDKINHIPRIPVMKHDGKWWAVNGNRRLFVYKMLQKRGLKSLITVDKVPYDPEWFEKAFNSKSGGKMVKIAGVNNMNDYEKHLDQIQKNVTNRWGTQNSSFFNNRGITKSGYTRGSTGILKSGSAGESSGRPSSGYTRDSPGGPDSDSGLLVVFGVIAAVAFSVFGYFMSKK